MNENCNKHSTVFNVLTQVVVFPCILDLVNVSTSPVCRVHCEPVILWRASDLLCKKKLTKLEEHFVNKWFILGHLIVFYFRLSGISFFGKRELVLIECIQNSILALMNYLKVFFLQ